MLEGSKKEVVLVSTVAALKRKSRFLKPVFAQLKADGVLIKVAASINPSAVAVGRINDEKERTILINLSRELDVPIRRIKINARFCIVDGSKLLVFVTPDSEDDKDIALWINSSFFGKAFTTFLTPIWRKK